MELEITIETMSINDILTEISIEGTIWDEIIENIIYPNSHLKPQLISEISLSYLENKEKIEKAWEEGYFKYYFINTIRNQVRSNTSSFHKNIRIKDSTTFDDGFDTEGDDCVEERERKELVEVRLGTIKHILNRLPITWFEHQMFIEYYMNNRTYRNIEEEYSLDHVLVWKTVKKVREMVIEDIKG